MDRLPRLGKRELICLLSFTCNYVVSVWRGFLFLWVLGMGYVILLWHSLSLPYNYYGDVHEMHSFSLYKFPTARCTKLILSFFLGIELQLLVFLAFVVASTPMVAML